MELLFIWFIFALLVGIIADNTTLGFWGGFLLSLILSPIVGFIITLFYPSKKTRQLQLMQQQQIIQQQQQILNQQTPSVKTFISPATELEKIEDLKQKNLITTEEYNKLREKIIAQI